MYMEKKNELQKTNLKKKKMWKTYDYMYICKI